MQFIYHGNAAPAPMRAGSRGGDSLHLPSSVLPCPLQPDVFCVYFQVLLTSPECFWGSCCAGKGWPCSLYQELPMAVCASHPEGCLSPGVEGMGPQGHFRAATGIWWGVLWSRTLWPCVLTVEIHSEEQRNRISATPHEGCPSSSTLRATKSRRLRLLPLQKS